MDFGLENPKLQGWVLLPLIAGVRHTRVALLVTCTASAYHRVLLSITNRLRGVVLLFISTHIPMKLSAVLDQNFPQIIFWQGGTKNAFP